MKSKHIHRFTIKGSITEDGVRKLHLECSECGKAKQRRQKVSQSARKCHQKPRTAIRKVSKSRKAVNQEYSAKRLLFLEEHRTCQFPGCRSAPDDIHHRRGRKGKLLTDTSHFMAICRMHHDWAHSNVAKAREMGIIQYSFR